MASQYSDNRDLSSSWTDGSDTTTMVENLRVPLQDIKAEESVGRVALVGCEDKVGWGELGLGKRCE